MHPNVHQIYVPDMFSPVSGMPMLYKSINSHTLSRIIQDSRHEDIYVIQKYVIGIYKMYLCDVRSKHNSKTGGIKSVKIRMIKTLMNDIAQQTQ